jgi:hypothetical protein
VHTAELLDEALALAAQLGFRVRQEWLHGAGGGTCVVRGEKWLFIDLAQSLAEQLACAAKVLCNELDVLQLASSSLIAYLKTADGCKGNPHAIASH